MKINFSPLKDKLKLDNIKNGFFSFLEKSNHWIFFFLFFLVAVFCVYLWYFFIYHNEWDAAKKQEYINSKDKGVIFSRDKFERLVKEKEDRSSHYQKTSENVPDIFRLNR